MPAIILLADVTFTDAGLAIIASLMASLCWAIRTMFLMGVRHTEQRLCEAERRAEKLLDVIVRCHMNHRRECHGDNPADKPPPGD